MKDKQPSHSPGRRNTRRFRNLRLSRRQRARSKRVNVSCLPSAPHPRPSASPRRPGGSERATSEIKRVPNSDHFQEQAAGERGEARPSRSRSRGRSAAQPSPAGGAPGREGPPAAPPRDGSAAVPRRAAQAPAASVSHCR